MDFGVNILGIIIASVLMMPLGAFMYSEKGLGNEWMKAIGKTKEDIENSSGSMGLLMGLALLSSFVTVFIINVFIVSVGVSNAFDLFLVVILIYLVVFFIRLKGTVFDDNFRLFKVNLISTFLEFALVFVVYLFII